MGTSVGRRDIRATSDGAELGTISYDGETGNAWTAVYSDLGDEAEQVAVAGQTRIMSWQATNLAGDRLGLTIFEVGELGGPGFGGCPAPTDFAGNAEAAPASRTWTIDTVRPTVTRTTPAAGARNVGPASNVTATFSEAMTASTLNGTTVRLVRASNGTGVGATVNYSPATRVVTLNPNANLVRGATYTATIVGGANGVKDTAGNAMATGMNWSFRIAP